MGYIGWLFRLDASWPQSPPFPIFPGRFSTQWFVVCVCRLAFCDWFSFSDAAWHLLKPNQSTIRCWFRYSAYRRSSSRMVMLADSFWVRRSVVLEVVHRSLYLVSWVLAKWITIRFSGTAIATWEMCCLPVFHLLSCVFGLEAYEGELLVRHDSVLRKGGSASCQAKRLFQVPIITLGILYVEDGALLLPFLSSQSYLNVRCEDAS